jgi:dolichol kinase
MNERQKKEISRKAVHISSLLLPLAYRYVFHSNKKFAFTFLLPLTLLALIVEIARLEHRTVKRIFYNVFGIMLRKHELHEFTGATYLLISSLFCIAVFPKDITFVALAFLAIGDTLAAIIGISYGKRKLLRTKKSLEGSLACFIGTFIFALFFLHPFIALVGAFFATVAEFSSIPVDDNIKIPLISGFFMSLANIIV